MHGYFEITSQEDLDRFIHQVKGFHDSVLREIHLVNRSFALEQDVYMNERMDGRLFIQYGNEPGGVEIVANEITDLKLSEVGALFDAKGKFVSEKLSPGKTITLDIVGGFSMTTRHFFYQFHSDWLGPKIYLDGEVPANDAIPSKIIDDGWRMCSNCQEAWEENTSATYSTCPKCGQLTYIQGDISDA